MFILIYAVTLKYALKDKGYFPARAEGTERLLYQISVPNLFFRDTWFES
jgi:hypothetical protein